MFFSFSVTMICIMFGMDYFYAFCIGFVFFVHGCAVSVRTTKRINRCTARKCDCNCN